MELKFVISFFRNSIIFLISVLLSVSCFGHDILFCGERIPVENDFVAKKLMDIIRRQMPGVNLLQLRRSVNENLPIVEYYLRETGLPEDLKYLAIVESGFQNVGSVAGAQGFWQLMPGTALERGLIVSPNTDERNNIYKSTYAACKVLASYYLKIRRDYGISSWVLTAAAYNYGIGNMIRSINKHGNNYFSMELNPETASYVYKIIAVKELFEYPEFYMKDFGYNIFSTAQQESNAIPGSKQIDTARFNTMELQVNNSEDQYPDELILKEPVKPGDEIFENKNQIGGYNKKYKYLYASIKGKYKHFTDGAFITVELQDDLSVRGSFARRGNTLKGKGWFIDNRIFIDLGFSEHYVTILDVNGQKGITPSSLKNDQPILLRVQQTFE